MHKTREAIDEQQKAEFILEGNKLIAEFMYPDNQYSTYYIEEHTFIECIYGNYDYHDTFTIDEMKYHSSWDWLMPIVEKIEEVNVVASFQIEQPTIYIWASSENSTFEDIEIEIFNKTKIEAVHQAVVEFIKWYNTNAANS